MNLFIYPYKAGSKSVKALSEALEVPRIKLKNSSFTPSADKTILNWGSSKLTQDITGSCKVLNKPEAVATAANKMSAFQQLRYQVSVPSFTTNKEEAQSWLEMGNTVVERHTLTGHSGEGVKIKRQGDVLEDCPLYVLYIPKKSEWRVHVFCGKVIAIQRKARDRSVPDEQVNWQVRNHGNGFIFARNDSSKRPRYLKQVSVQAVEALGLDFGAVDLIYNEKNNQLTVLEVNTACGVVGTTLDNYVEAIKEYMGTGGQGAAAFDNRQYGLKNIMGTPIRRPLSEPVPAAPVAETGVWGDED